MTKTKPKSPPSRRSSRVLLKSNAKVAQLEHLLTLTTADLKTLLFQTNKLAAATECKWVETFVNHPLNKQNMISYFEPSFDCDYDDEFYSIFDAKTKGPSNKVMFIKSIVTLRQKIEAFHSLNK